jgi:hypothetical protein
MEITKKIFSNIRWNSRDRQRLGSIIYN